MGILERLIMGCVMFVLVSFGAYQWGITNGQEEIQTLWDIDRAALVKANLDNTTQHVTDMAELVDQHKQTNIRNTDAHESALEKVHAQLLASRADAARRGGLRIPTNSVCPDPTSAITEATSAIQRHEEATATVKLPDRIEDGLWAIVARADEVVEQARACQAWIKDNDFYDERDLK